MGCIETQVTVEHEKKPFGINRNMGCIETHDFKKNEKSNHTINRNMGCIETVVCVVCPYGEFR